MSESLSIALISCHFPPDSIGGGQVQSYRLCAALATQHRVTACIRDYTGALPEEESVEGFRIIRRSVSKIPVLRSFIDLCKALAWMRRHRNEYDLFLAFHVQLAALMVVLGRRLFGLTVAVSPRGQEDFDFRGWARTRLQKFVYRWTAAILVQSPGIQTLFSDQIRLRFSRNEADLILRKIQLLPNVIPDHGRRPKPQRLVPDRIIFVGRLVSDKGLMFLIEAMKGLSVAAELMIIGDGPERIQLQQAAFGLPVTFLGGLSPQEVRGHLEKASLLVLPSLTENLPNVVLEALEASVPVVATTVGALPELVENGKNGFLVPPADPDALRASIEKALRSTEHWDQLCRGARMTAEPFSVTALLPTLNEVLRKVVLHA